MSYNNHVSVAQFAKSTIVSKLFLEVPLEVKYE